MIHKTELEAANERRAKLEADMAAFEARGGKATQHDITERAEDRPKLKYGKPVQGVEE